MRFQGLKLSFDGRVLMDDFSFKLERQSIVGVIGANGMGKSTLFRLITGELVPSSASAVGSGERLVIQAPDEGTLDIGDTVKLGYVEQSRDGLNPLSTVRFYCSRL